MIAKIGTAVGLLRLLAELAKIINDFVKLSESEDKDDGEKRGEQKRELVLDLITLIYRKADNYVEIPIEKEEILDVVGSLIEVFVKFHNAIGNFRSKS